MSNFPEPTTPGFVPVYQLKRTDAVDAGAAGDGPSNVPLKNLVERTAYLKKEVDDLDTALGGVVIGSTVQAYDDDLQAIAALTTTGLIDRTGAGTATTRATGATGLAVLASADAAAARTATNTAENLEAIDSWRDGSHVTNWTRFPATLNTIIAKNRARGLTSGAMTTPTGTYPGSDAYVGGVLLPDGRVFCIPANATSARIYDPATDTLTTPAGTYPGSGGYAGGVLLPDGRVFCIPYNATTARIYNPATDTLTTPAGTYPGSGGYSGGVLLPDGRVFCVPYNATTARIYDPATDTLTTPAGTYPGSAAYAGGVLLPDGRVFCVPTNATTARIAATRSHVSLDSNITLSPFFNKL